MFLGLQANPPVAAANPIPIPSPKGSAGLASLQPEQKSSIMIEAQKQQHQQASKQLEEMLNQASHQASKAAATSANSAAVSSGNLLRQQISGLSSNPPHQNLMQLLNDPTLKQKSAKGPVIGKTSQGPSLGKTSLVAANSLLAASGVSVASTGTTSKSSNSQLFKNSDSSSGSSAIPLTFNNSIAEVLAAAAKSKSREASSGGSIQTSNFGPTKTSEVTITAKSFNKTTASWTSGSTSTLTSSSGSSGKKHHQFGKPMNQSGKVNPLLEMRNFLSHTNPGIPPHIVAQNTLSAASSLPTKPTISTHQMAGTMPKIAPKPSGSLLKPLPVAKPSGAGIGSGSTISSSGSSKSGSGITSVNKKSLNTVLDRLSGFKSTPSLGNMSGGSVIQQQQPQTGSAASSNFRQTATSSPSSLVQQLQAPPIMTNPSMGSPTKNHNRVPSSNPNIPTVVGPASMRPQPASDGGQGQSSTGSSTSQASKLQSLQTLMAQQAGLLNMAGYPGASASGLVGQPMVQYPWPTTGASSATSSAQQASAIAEAQRAMVMAGAGLPGMNSAAASAAFTEILKMSLQAQQAKGGQKTGNQQATGSGSNSGQQAPRIRAPPPLTHMGRQGGSGNQSSQTPNKPHKQPE
jgi:hypothetical protein